LPSASNAVVLQALKETEQALRPDHDALSSWRAPSLRRARSAIWACSSPSKRWSVPMRWLHHSMPRSLRSRLIYSRLLRAVGLPRAH